MKMVRSLIVFGCICMAIVEGLPGTVYYVSMDGADSNTGSQLQPWRTIQKAADTLNPGDQVLVASGDYREYVDVSRAGAAGNPVSFVADGEVKLRAFRLQQPHVRIDGFTLSGAQNTWLAHVRIEANASHCEIHNCHFGPGVYVMANDFVWNATDNSVSSPSVNFVAAGFEAGANCFFGASGMDGLWYDNHDTDHMIATVMPTKMTFSTPLLPETKNPAWAPIFAGRNRNGIDGVKFVIKNGGAAVGCRITGCRFEDLFGMAIDLLGEGHEVDHNVFTDTNSYYGIRPNGSNHTIHDNLFIDCSNFLFYTPAETAAIPHPAGSTWFDYQVGFFHSAQGGDNIHFHHNWVENLNYRLGQISEVTGVSGFVIEHNVFVGIGLAYNGGRDGTAFRNNTFYKVGFDYPATSALAVGGNSASTPQNDLVINRNVFVACGSHWKPEEGSYQVTPYVTNAVIDENFVAQFETNGYAPQPELSEPNGINGGDPMFFDPENPRGPDGLPFTADDGLRPLPNSPFAMRGWGALTPVAVVPGQPIAHFRVATLSGGLGWKDATRYDYDPAWLAKLPYERVGPVRPHAIPEAFGEPGVEVSFDATGSIGGLTEDSVDNSGITTYEWDFGDGDPVRTSSPIVEHVFAQSGTVKVRLTVTNRLGGRHSIERTYRILGDGPGIRVDVPRNLQIIGS